MFILVVRKILPVRECREEVEDYLYVVCLK